MSENPVIEISGHRIKALLVRGTSLDMDMCGAVVESFCQIEFDHISGRDEVHPRQFVPPDWAVRSA
jgi:hypothetical protein